MNFIKHRISIKNAANHFLYQDILCLFSNKHRKRHLLVRQEQFRIVFTFVYVLAITIQQENLSSLKITIESKLEIAHKLGSFFSFVYHR